MQFLKEFDNFFLCVWKQKESTKLLRKPEGHRLWGNLVDFSCRTEYVPRPSDQQQQHIWKLWVRKDGSGNPVTVTTTHLLLRNRKRPSEIKESSVICCQNKRSVKIFKFKQHNVYKNYATVPLVTFKMHSDSENTRLTVSARKLKLVLCHQGHTEWLMEGSRSRDLCYFVLFYNRSNERVVASVTVRPSERGVAIVHVRCSEGGVASPCTSGSVKEAWPLCQTGTVKEAWPLPARQV